MNRYFIVFVIVDWSAQQSTSSAWPGSVVSFFRTCHPVVCPVRLPCLSALSVCLVCLPCLPFLLRVSVGAPIPRFVSAPPRAISWLVHRSPRADGWLSLIVGWLVDWSIGWLVDWLSEWLIGWWKGNRLHWWTVLIDYKYSIVIIYYAYV